MNEIEKLLKKIKKKARRIKPKTLNWLIAIFAAVIIVQNVSPSILSFWGDIELFNVSAVFKTITNVISRYPGFFESVILRIAIIAILIILIMLKICASIKETVIIIRHSTFSNFMLSYDRECFDSVKIIEKEINLVNEMHRNDITGAIQIQDGVIKSIINNCNRKNQLFYYGIAHSPLIFRAGFQIGSAVYVRLLHHDHSRGSNFKELAADDDVKKRLKVNRQFIPGNTEEMLVIIETSLKIKDDDLAVFMEKKPCCILRFSPDEGSTYSFDDFASYGIMKRLREQILQEIETQIACDKSKISRIHLVLSTSSAFTFFLGQGFSQNYFPEVVAYHYDYNTVEKYPWGLYCKAPTSSALVRNSIPAEAMPEALGASK